jgi:hypothetical protein
MASHPQGHQLDGTKAMPVGDQHHVGVAMAVAIGPGRFDEAVDFGVGQVFARPRLGPSVSPRTIARLPMAGVSPRRCYWVPPRCK